MFKPKLSRGRLRGAEIRCTNQLKAHCTDRIREICRTFLELLEDLDNYTLGIYPVFELVDSEVRNNKARFVADDEGYRLIRPDGFVLSQGATMREWLINHVSQHG
jgi:hypothetical protein